MLFIAALMILPGCGSSNAKGGNNSLLAGAPEWVRKSGYGNSDKICAAVGMDTSADTITDDLDYATDRARTELGKQLGIVIKAVHKDYRAKTKGQGMRDDEEKVVDASIGEVNNITVSGSQRVDAWDNGKQLYALVCIDFAKFANAIKDMKNMSEELKAAITERAEKEWDELRNRDK